MNKNKTYKKFEFNEKWISDGIKERYKAWYTKEDAHPLTSSTRVLIDSATGTGKTSFILNKLLPYAAQKNRHILYLGNRVALEEQLEKQLQQKNMIDITDEYVDKSITTMRIYNYPNTESTITLLSYQSLIKTLGLNDYRFNPYYVIVDEAHFFLADALFNRKTFDIWITLLQNFLNSVLIFTTATVDEFRKIFDDDIPWLGAIHQEHQQIYNEIYTPDIEIYQNNYSNTAYRFMCYYKFGEIVSKIRQSDEKERWMIFVNSKKEGIELYEKIETATGRKVKFLSADSKKTKAWKLLIEENRFNADVLIVTKVIDNGVNIIDNTVKHIVLPFCDKADFLQMLGRRRFINESDEINIYVEQPSVQKLNSLLFYLKPQLYAMSELRRLQKYYEGEKYRIKAEILIRKLWNKRNNDLMQLFSLRPKYGPHMNEFAFYRLELLEEFYSSQLKEYQVNKYLDDVLSWVKMSKGKMCHIYCENCYTFSEFINKFSNKDIQNSEWESFYYGFQHYYKIECNIKFATDSKKLKEALNIRKGKTQRKATMNKSLKMLNLPYEIKKEKGCWVLKKTE